ncbi:MAG: PD40 domain-containing protein [Bacteroidetes bacterium]|nr:PD40 domain-containing protein [Bacteroidota bacterium]
MVSCKSLNLRIAENYFDQYAYSKAIPKYEKVLRKDYVPLAATHLAESYRKTGNSLKAEIWYKRIVKSPQVTLQDKLDLAEVLMENGKYLEAKIWYLEYLKFNASDKKVKRMIQACDSTHLFFVDTLTYEISLLKINRDLESNFSPAFYKQGLVFLSDRTAPGKNKDRSEWTGKEYLDLFYTRRIDIDNWLEPELLKGDINGLYDEGPAVFSKDNTTIYFTRNDYSGDVVEKNNKDISLLKLYYGKLYGNQWKLETQMPFNSNEYSVGHPALSPDGRTMYFVSDKPWGYGGTDIYKVSMANGKWSEPENLGTSINSEGNEMFPFVAADSVLYFASDGHIGLGGLDIFSSFWDGLKWSKAENLQHPINSSKDDFGFIIDSVNAGGYFTSNRIKNSDKIFGFKKNPPIYLFQLLVTDKKTSKPIKSFSLESFTASGGNKINVAGVNGEANMNLATNTDYKLIVKSAGYYAKLISFSTVGKRKSETIENSISLDKIELNKAIVWKSILFNKKDTKISVKTEQALDSLFTILELNPAIQIEIASHTDSRGSFVDNMNISRKRSDEIAMYLINKGINPPRLISIGYGEGKLLNYCRDGVLCLEEDHQVNNRVEISVIGLLK